MQDVIGIAVIAYYLSGGINAPCRGEGGTGKIEGGDVGSFRPKCVLRAGTVDIGADDPAVCVDVVALGNVGSRNIEAETILF